MASRINKVPLSRFLAVSFFMTLVSSYPMLREISDSDYYEDDYESDQHSSQRWKMTGPHHSHSHSGKTSSKPIPVFDDYSKDMCWIQNDIKYCIKDIEDPETYFATSTPRSHHINYGDTAPKDHSILYCEGKEKRVCVVAVNDPDEYFATSTHSSLLLNGDDSGSSEYDCSEGDGDCCDEDEECDDTNDGSKDDCCSDSVKLVQNWYYVILTKDDEKNNNKHKALFKTKHPIDKHQNKKHSRFSLIKNLGHHNKFF